MTPIHTRRAALSERDEIIRDTIARLQAATGQPVPEWALLNDGAGITAVYLTLALRDMTAAGLLARRGGACYVVGKVGR